VKQAAEMGFMTESGWRYLIFHADTNGFNKVIKRIGRKILLDYSAFELWLKEENEKKS
jgi:hypothetical protein